MVPRIIVTVDASLPEANHQDWRELCTSLASLLDKPVDLALMQSEAMDAVWGQALAGPDMSVTTFQPVPPPDVPMSSAPFVWQEDGTPRWGAMWESFCELALYGGPPHRGPRDTLTVEAVVEPVEPEIDAVEEIRRGIWETTGLYSEPAPGSWLAVKCSDRQMAAWMCACIILENVDARCEGDILFVPASADFQLKDQVKSVITVVAKVNHYWQAHAGTLGV